MFTRDFWISASFASNGRKKVANPEGVFSQKEKEYTFIFFLRGILFFFEVKQLGAFKITLGCFDNTSFQTVNFNKTKLEFVLMGVWCMIFDVKWSAGVFGTKAPFVLLTKLMYRKSLSNRRGSIVIRDKRSRWLPSQIWKFKFVCVACSPEVDDENVPHSTNRSHLH